ncbi:MAG: hypothetical protein HY541_04540 [Deltaproteobacteria bacterium]|nr:hypothetical protein [Deltaproteobacteria bacterium]
MAIKMRKTSKGRYHGRPKGYIVSAGVPLSAKKVQEHPFFGMMRKSRKPVRQVMRELRGGRYRAR